MLRFLMLAALVIFLVLGASVAYLNAEPVTFNYLAGQIEIPLIVLLIGEFVIAVLITLLICFARIIGLRTEIRRLRKQVRDAEAELKALRDLPLSSTGHNAG